MNKRTIQILARISITAVFFWVFDFVIHYTGVGETNFYYTSKFGNAVLFAIIWFGIVHSFSSWKQIGYSFLFGTYISFYYLIASYSGLIQFFFGIYARYTPPPFVIFDIMLSPVWWWVFHSGAFYIGIRLAEKFVPFRR